MISQRMDYTALFALNKIKSVIVKAGLPVSIPGLDIEKIMQAMKHDKKKAEGKIKFVLPTSVGEGICQ